MTNGARKVYRIGEITRQIKAVLERTFGEVWVEGEISNFSRPASGHIYFTLKDDSAQLGGVMFRGNQAGLKFKPADGMLVQACGEVSVYEKSGRYQIIVRQMEEAGKGSLQAAFEALKKKLQAEGLFESARKRPLPLLPRHIGIVTSPTGAAIRDILKILGRRYPNLHVVIAPVRVQGQGAAREIAAAIQHLNTLGGLDVLIVGRGGGSLEDLWCFNEEVVARSVADSRIPVISAVGHEIDFTICDFVADVRAPTPSAAAEQVVGQKELIERQMDEYGRRLARPIGEAVLKLRNRLLAGSRGLAFYDPRNTAARHLQQVQQYRMRMIHCMQGRLRETQQHVDDAGLRASHRVWQTVDATRQGVQRVEAQLRALNPLAVLVRGYSITRDETGEVLRSTDGLRAGVRVSTTLSKGQFESEITALAGGNTKARTDSGL
ncbi:MAG: exodeoxyribonuclease VII large subunit [bacterium]